MKKKTDLEILENIRARDEKTMHYLFKEYLPIIKYMVSNYKYSDGKIGVSGNESDVNDLFHDALYIVIKKITSENFELTSKLSTYFYAVSKNLLRTRLQKRLVEKKHRGFIEGNIYEPEETDVLFDKNLKKDVFEYYFQALSKVCKEILNMYWLEYSVAEISSKLGNTEKYIRKRKYECQKRLIDFIKKNPDNI